MKKFLFLSTLLAATLAFGQTRTDLKVEKLAIGNATSATKTVEFNTGNGSSNGKIVSSASGDVTLYTADPRVGLGVSGDQTLAFDRGSGATNPKLKWNESIQKIQYSNDGTNFSNIGSGSGSGKNYITGGDAESGTTGFATYADAAGTSPVDGTGGSASVTWATSATTPLEGLNSFLLTKGASNRQGDGVSYAFTIDRQDQAKVLQISFNYLVNSGTFVAGTSSTASDVTIWIYDVTNGVVIQPSSYKLLSNNTSIADRFNATFQSAGNSTSYRLIFHVGSTSASAYALKIDSISVGPSTYTYGTPITDWQSYTPTITNFTQGNGTIAGKWRRVGDSMEIAASIRLGSTSSLAGAPRINPPSGYSIDTNKTSASDSAVAHGWAIDVSASTRYVLTGFINSGGVDIQSNATGVVGASTPFVWASGDYIDMQIIVPITGWSSSVQTSDQTDTRIVAARMYRNAGQTVGPNGSDIKVLLDTVDTTYGPDTHAGSNTGSNRYDIKVSGWYKIYGVVDVASSNVGNWQYAVRFYKNGVLAGKGPYIIPPAAFAFRQSASDLIYCNAGDYIEMYLWGLGNNSASTLTLNGGNNTTYMTVERVTGPSQIAATESVNARIYAASNLTAGPNNSSVKVAFDTRDTDSHSAFDTTNKRYVAPISGMYEVSAQLLFQSTNVLANTYILDLYKNGSVAYSLASVTPAVTTQFSLVGSTQIRLNAGDYIEINVFGSGNNSASTLTVTGAQRYSSFTIKRIGN